MKRRLLDLYCCAGGAAKGYADAGFDVVGVDIDPQPRYPFEFHQGDAIEFARAHGHEFDLIHASPPCQAYSAPTRGTNAGRHPHAELIPQTREVLDGLGVPYVIENVAGAPIRKDLRLCGEMFDLGVIMHRFFEFGNYLPLGTTVPVPAPVHRPHRGRVRGWRHGVYHDGPYVAAYGNGGGKATVAEMQQAKGIIWTHDRTALCEAIPPAYMRYIGAALLASLGAGEVAA